MKKFLITILKFSTIGGIPFLLLTAGYFYFDPFRVLRPYPDYSYSNVIPNRDFISTEMFLRNKDKYHYNSFIFGSSRALAYRPEDWKKYLEPGDSPFAFDASGESLFGIYTKIKLIDSLGVPLDNVLIIIDRETTFTFTENFRALLFVKHPATSGESGYSFHKIFFTAYFDPKFLACYYTFTFTHKYKDWMKGYIEWRKIRYDTITNQTDLESLEAVMQKDENAYYTEKRAVFYERKGEAIDTAIRIDQKRVDMLNELVQIFKKHHTNYKVINSPLYDEMKFSAHDWQLLKSVFGDHLYDFSGKNTFTEDFHNYYEPYHYRPRVGDSILQIIYEDVRLPNR